MSDFELSEQRVEIPAYLFSGSEQHRIKVPVQRPLLPFMLDGIYFMPYLTAEYIATDHRRADGKRLYILVLN